MGQPMHTHILLAILAVFFIGDASAEVAEAPADSVRKYKFLAKTARGQKEYAEARTYYGQLVKYSPRDVQARFFLGDMNYRLRDFDGARAAFESALALDSLHVNSNLRLYTVYAAADLADSAALCLERVLAVKPDAEEYRRKLADLYRREGASERAIVHYAQLVGDGVDEELFEMLALLNQDIGNIGEALRWRSRLLGGDGEVIDPEKLESVVELQLETGDVDSALKSLFKLALVDSANAYSYYSRVSTIAEERGNEAVLLKAREGMVRANPKDLQTVAELVEWNINQDQFKAARRLLDRGLLGGGNARLLVLKGDLLLREGAEEEAVAAYEQAKADPAWERVAQQRIWKINPPETEEEKLKREFFGGKDGES